MKTLQLLRHNKDYAWLFFADVINSIGAIFTSVLIYYSLDTFNAPAWWFTFAYLAVIIPTYFGALCAEKVGKNFHYASVTIGANLFALIFLSVTIYGFLHQQLWMIILSEIAISLAMGFIAPFHTFYHAKRFNQDEYASITIIDTVRFGLESVIGFAMGSWMVTVFAPEILFTTDAITYLLSSMVVFVLMKQVSRAKKISNKQKAEYLITKPNFNVLPPITTMSDKQQRLFWLIPMVAVMGMPIMCLGPVLTKQVDTSHVAISGVLLFLLARTCGQFLGPLVTNLIHFEKLSEKKSLLPLCALVFFSCYYFASYSTTLTIMIFLVIIAHLFSNIASMTAYYSLLHEFNGAKHNDSTSIENISAESISIESVSAKQNQYATILGFTSAMLSTLIFSVFGINGFFLYVSVVWLGLCGFSIM